MELTIFASLVAYACATTFSPGPNNVLLLSCSGMYGFKKCIPLLRGIWTGLITVMIICGFACSIIGDLIPKIAPVARIVGAAYIVWLGYKTLTKKLPAEDASQEEKAANTPLTFVHGFLLQFLNVKILMLGVAAYCSFVLPTPHTYITTLIFSLTMAVCAACGNLIWVTTGTLLFPIYRKYYRVFNILMALLLFYCVYKILFV